MRNFKFRCWSKKENAWMFGYEYPNLGGFSLIGETVLLGEFSAYPLERYYEDFEITQWTGLKDKNKKDIYEGDIVVLPDTESEFVDVGIGVDMKVAETPVRSIGEIKYLSGGFGIYFKETGECWEKGFNSFHTTDYTKMFSYDITDLENVIEVIGNIFENPELLNE